MYEVMDQDPLLGGRLFVVDAAHGGPFSAVAANRAGHMVETSSFPGNISASASEVEVEEPQQPQPPTDQNRLILCYHGQVYDFPSMQPEKVHAAMLLLSREDTLANFPGMASTLHQATSEISKPINIHRLASLQRYREKKKRLCFEKKVLYDVRKEVASRMKREKGQFASSKPKNDNAAPISSSSDPSKSNSDEERHVCCLNCGASKSSTPQMRKGPGGPNSLCNACGLVWAKQGELRSIPSASNSGAKTVTVDPNEQGAQKDSGIGSNSNMAEQVLVNNYCGSEEMNE